MGQDIAVVQRLLSSFVDLELAIESAKKSLQARGLASRDVLGRLDSYSEILAKQRELTAELEGLIRNDRHDDVSRQIRIINGLSNLIVEDAQDVFAQLSAPLAAVDASSSWC